MKNIFTFIIFTSFVVMSYGQDNISDLKFEADILNKKDVFFNKKELRKRNVKEIIVLKNRSYLKENDTVYIRKYNKFHQIKFEFIKPYSYNAFYKRNYYYTKNNLDSIKEENFDGCKTFKTTYIFGQSSILEKEYNPYADAIFIEKHTYIRDSLLSEDSADVGTTRKFTYNTKNQTIRVVKFRFNETLKDSIVTIYKYNKNNDISEKEILVTDNFEKFHIVELPLKERYIYKYDTLNRPVSIKILRNGKINETKEISYSTKGKTIDVYNNHRLHYQFYLKHIITNIMLEQNEHKIRITTFTDNTGKLPTEIKEIDPNDISNYQYYKFNYKY